MRARIDEDPMRALTRMHVDTPGNYNPIVEASQAAKATAAQTVQAKAGPSHDTATSTESARPKHISTKDSHTPAAIHIDADKDDTISLDYNDPDNLYMGPG
jgi:hypothetical protein